MTEPRCRQSLPLAEVLGVLSAAPFAAAIFLSGPLQLLCIALGVLLWIWALSLLISSFLPPWIKEPRYWRPIAWLLTHLYGEYAILIKQGGEWRWRCPYSDHWNHNLNECPCGAVLDMKRGRARMP
jgi:hypothetical protein